MSSSNSAVEGALEILRRAADELPSPELARQAEDLAQRVSEGLFYVACVGQFKRGKSTLLNALIGEEVLPTGVPPVTAVITILRFGPSRRATVRFADGERRVIDIAEIGEFVVEGRNRGNRRPVQAVDVELPSPLLASGMCLVDTPGLGSSFHANSETTRQFLPHIDAALLVIGGDPPITGAEATLLDDIGAQTAIYVLNKADRLSEKELLEADQFCRSVVRERLGYEIELFIISALERLNGSASRDWGKLEERLTRLARESGVEMVRSARGRGVERLSALLMREIEEQRQALLSPLAESERRVADLRETVGEAQRSMRDLSFLFIAEENVLNRRFAGEREHFLAAASPGAVEELQREMRTSPQNGVALRSFAFRSAQRLAEQRIRQWLTEVEPRAETMYRHAVERFVQLAREFVARIEADLVQRIDFDQGFRIRRHFFFNDLSTLTGRSPGSSAVDLFRTRRSFRAKAGRDAEMFLRRLLESNLARVANDLSERVLESRRRLEAEIREQLETMIASAERAAERAREAQTAGAARVSSELQRLDALRAKLAPPVNGCRQNRSEHRALPG